MAIEFYLLLAMFHSCTLEVTGVGFFGHNSLHSLNISKSPEKQID